ncbi:MAG: phytoene/squalene synthase family protein [Myxococcales bacterium]|nr:phytoene/squalene synthase family protein [Myxococcales bacterium]
MSLREAVLVARGYDACRETTRAHAASFYLASHALGGEARRGAYAVYAFCRRIDDAIDEAEGAPREELERRVGSLRAMLDSVCSFDALEDPSLAALRDTLRRFGLERRPFDELIDGVAWDVTLEQVKDDEEFYRYCYLVAGTVGAMMAQLFGTTGPEALPRATDLGIAMQITNILRDVREDFRQRGRVYLPQTALDRHGVTRGDLARDSATPALRALVAEYASRAKERYESADEGIPMITSAAGRAATTVMRAAYSEILVVLEDRSWDVLAGRARVSTAGKLSAVARYSVERFAR